MTKTTYTFTKQKNTPPTEEEVLEWKRLQKELRTTFKDWLLKLYDTKPVDFKVTIDKVRGSELRAYWVLIGVVTSWMNEQGNHFTKEEVSDWFKLRAGHSKGMYEERISRSIAVKSDCTWQDMKKLIDYIIQFGAENQIRGCELKKRDEEELEKLYHK